MKYIAVIPSGGRGIRFGSNVPKQYITVKDKEIIAYTLEIFQKNDLISDIIVAAEKKYFELIEKIKKKYSISKLTEIVEGGNERQDSVYNALIALNAREDDFIVVHDAARPLLRQEILNKALNLSKDYDNVVVALNSRDTVSIGEDFVADYIDRKKVWLIQTPQISRYGVLLRAMKKAYENNYIATDESSLLFNIGEKIKYCDGDVFNLKITNESDLLFFEMLISVIE
jgi:2-C-methyl-D-erythritol 4-phosphate cytidylyltransferase